MRLPDDIRSLPGRRFLLRDRRLRTAFHEACHAVTSIRFGREFVCVEIVRDEPVTILPVPGTPVARIVFGQVRWQTQAKDDAVIALAGLVCEQILNPHNRGLALLGGGMKDFDDAMEIVAFGGRYIGVADDADKETCYRYIEESVVPVARQMILGDWPAIMKVAEALAAKGKLEYAEVSAIVSACATNPEVAT